MSNEEHLDYTVLMGDLYTTIENVNLLMMVRKEKEAYSKFIRNLKRNYLNLEKAMQMNGDL